MNDGMDSKLSGMSENGLCMPAFCEISKGKHPIVDLLELGVAYFRGACVSCLFNIL